MTALAPHVARYFELVDAYLANVPLNERDTLISREIAKQEKLFERFQEKVDQGLPTSPEVTAFDFHETLAGLERRRAKRAA